MKRQISPRVAAQVEASLMAARFYSALSDKHLDLLHELLGVEDGEDAHDILVEAALEGSATTPEILQRLGVELDGSAWGGKPEPEPLTEAVQ